LLTADFADDADFYYPRNTLKTRKEKIGLLRRAEDYLTIEFIESMELSFFALLACLAGGIFLSADFTDDADFTIHEIH